MSTVGGAESLPSWIGAFVPHRCELGIQHWLKVSLIKSRACQSVSSWINYIMIFLIKAKPEQISPWDQKPSCAMYNIARLLSQLRIFWKVSCLSGTAKLPTTLTGFQICKMRARSWSVKSNLQETFPFHHPLLMLPSVAVLFSTSARHEFMLHGVSGHCREAAKGLLY